MDSNKKRKTNGYNKQITIGKENRNPMNSRDDSNGEASHRKIPMKSSKSIVDKGPTYSVDMDTLSRYKPPSTTPFKDITNSKFTDQI